jgi:hypothetical protein
MAQEVDRNPIAASSQFFNMEVLDKCIRESAVPAFAHGTLDFDVDMGVPWGFRDEGTHGFLHLWCPLVKDGKPSNEHPYCMGADVSAGTGASNSTLSIANMATGRKAAEYASPNVEPHELATLAAALGRWFSDRAGLPARLVVEGNGGHNRLFLRRLQDLHYENIWHDADEHGKRNKSAGWGAGRNTKKELLGDYSRALQVGDYENTSKEALEECKQYVYTGQGADGGVEHIGQHRSRDPSGAKENHGDRVIADALSWLGMKDRRVKPRAFPPAPPPGSFAERRAARRRASVVGRLWSRNVL